MDDTSVDDASDSPAPDFAAAPAPAPDALPTEGVAPNMPETAVTPPPAIAETPGLAPAEPADLAQHPAGASPDALTLYPEAGQVEESGGTATPVTLQQQDAPLQATLYADADTLQQVAENTTGEEQTESIPAYASPDTAEAQLTSAAPIMVRPEGDAGGNGETATMYVEADRFDAVMGEATAEESNGLSIYPDEAMAAAEGGATVPLLVRLEDEEETFIVYVDGERIEEFLAEAEAEDTEGTALIYADPDVAAETIDDPAPFLLRAQGERETVLIYANAEGIDDLMTAAETADLSGMFTGYAAEDVAGDETANPIPLLVKREDDEEIVTVFVDEEEFENILETATPYESEQLVEKLARDVYALLRRRLTIERERAR